MDVAHPGLGVGDRLGGDGVGGDQDLEAVGPVRSLGVKGVGALAREVRLRGGHAVAQGGRPTAREDGGVPRDLERAAPRGEEGDGDRPGAVEGGRQREDALTAGLTVALADEGEHGHLGVRRSQLRKVVAVPPNFGIVKDAKVGRTVGDSRPRGEHAIEAEGETRLCSNAPDELALAWDVLALSGRVIGLVGHRRVRAGGPGDLGEGPLPGGERGRELLGERSGDVRRRLRVPEIQRRLERPRARRDGGGPGGRYEVQLDRERVADHVEVVGVVRERLRHVGRLGRPRGGENERGQLVALARAAREGAGVLVVPVPPEAPAR